VGGDIGAATATTATTGDNDTSVATTAFVKENRLIYGAPAAANSGTTVDYTGIPAGTKRIVVSFFNVSTNGTSFPMVQIGDSGGIETTGYISNSSRFSNAAAVVSDNSTTGFHVSSANAANTLNGQMILTLLNAATFVWAASGSFTIGNATANIIMAGSKVLTAELDRVRLTTVNGTDAFDGSGSINIQYE
jgi:hypothetical protein